MAPAVPAWSEVSVKADRGEVLIALERFVYDQEPAGSPANAFREQLAAVLAEVIPPRKADAPG